MCPAVTTIGRQRTTSPTQLATHQSPWPLSGPYLRSSSSPRRRAGSSSGRIPTCTPRKLARSCNSSGKKCQRRRNNCTSNSLTKIEWSMRKKRTISTGSNCRPKPKQTAKRPLPWFRAWKPAVRSRLARKRPRDSSKLPGKNMSEKNVNDKIKFRSNMQSQNYFPQKMSIMKIWKPLNPFKLLRKQLQLRFPSSEGAGDLVRRSQSKITLLFSNRNNRRTRDKTSKYKKKKQLKLKSKAVPRPSHKIPTQRDQTGSPFLWTRTLSKKSLLL